MKRKLFIIRDSFVPNAAPINRFLAFAKGYGELGIEVHAVFVYPNKEFEKVHEQYANVKFIYLWDNLPTKNKYLKSLITRIRLLFFIFRLKNEERVIIYGLMHFLWFIRLKKGIRLYHECTESPDIIGRKYGIIGNFKHFLYLHACKTLEGLFVISPSLNRYFENTGVNRNKIYTINMIVDLSRFDNLFFKNRNNSITYCGTISERKDGISDLIRAFGKISKINDFITLTLIGRFENEETRQNVIKQINYLGLGNRIFLTGEISAQKMPKVLKEAKILVLSRPNNKQAQYGFPTKLGEYLMTGNPVVITRVGDFDKYLEDKKDVIFSNPGDVDDFANQLKWTLDNYTEALNIGLNGKKIAMEKFNYRIESQKVINVIFTNN